MTPVNRDSVETWRPRPETATLRAAGACDHDPRFVTLRALSDSGDPRQGPGRRTCRRAPGRGPPGAHNLWRVDGARKAEGETRSRCKAQANAFFLSQVFSCLFSAQGSQFGSGVGPFSVLWLLSSGPSPVEWKATRGLARDKTRADPRQDCRSDTKLYPG